MCQWDMLKQKEKKAKKFLGTSAVSEGIPKNWSSQVFGELWVSFLAWILTQTHHSVNKRPELFRTFLGRPSDLCLLLEDFFGPQVRHRIWQGEGSTAQWKWSPPSPGSLMALLSPDLVNQVYDKGRKRYKWVATHQNRPKGPENWCCTKITQNYFGGEKRKTYKERNTQTNISRDCPGTRKRKHIKKNLPPPPSPGTIPQFFYVYVFFFFWYYFWHFWESAKVSHKRVFALLTPEIRS